MLLLRAGILPAEPNIWSSHDILKALSEEKAEPSRE